MVRLVPHPARCRRRVRARGADTHAGGLDDHRSRHRDCLTAPPQHLRQTAASTQAASALPRPVPNVTSPTRVRSCSGRSRGGRAAVPGGRRAGATRGPVRGVGGRGGGCGRGGGFARRGPAGGLMAGVAGARRPTRIAGSSAAHGPLMALLEPAKSPLRARYAAPTRRRPPSTAVRSADPHGPGRSGPTGRLGCPSPPPHSASLSRPPERMWTDGRPPAAAIQEGPLP